MKQKGNESGERETEIPAFRVYTERGQVARRERVRR